MELSLVEITPSPDREPAANASVAATPSGAALELSLDKPLTPADAQEIELIAFGAKRAPVAQPAGEPAAKPAAVAPPPVDPFMAEALREYKDGNIDLPLWSRAIEKHEGDQPKAIAVYLQARATVLKLEQRHRRSSDPLPPVRAAIPLARPLAGSSRDDDDEMIAVASSRTKEWRKYAAMSAPVVVALVVGVWWMLGTSDHDSVQAAFPVATAPAAAGTAVPAAAHVARTSKEEDPNTYFAGKILDLKAAGNWNVLVLFASEWTRKQPTNAQAWRELSVGYSNMRQFNDALDAGTKAVQLAPNDSLAWRNLAQVNLDLKEPEAALKAYERAVAVNELDMISLLQVGTLSVQLNRLPQARSAFELVLAAEPDSTEAMCGMSMIAQRQGRGKDADAITKQLRSTDRQCRETPAAVTVATRK